EYSTPTGSDNCEVANVTCVPASGSSFAVGTTPVNCVVRDAAGNQSNCSFNVKAIDGDADGDGVSNCFDGCPNTPPGTLVDPNTGCDLPIEVDNLPPVQLAIDPSYQREVINSIIRGICGMGSGMVTTGVFFGILGMRWRLRRRRGS